MEYPEFLPFVEVSFYLKVFINSIEKLLILHLVNEFWVYQPYCMRFEKCMATLGGQSFYNFQSFPFGAHFYYTVIHTVEMDLLIKMSILCILPLIKRKDVAFLEMFCLKIYFIY